MIFSTSFIRVGAMLPATFAVVAALAQTPPQQAPPQQQAPGQAQPQKPAQKPGTPKPYDEVITKEAVSQEGLFKVHRIDDKVYFEIPPAMYSRDLLLQTEISELPNGFAFIGAPNGTRVVTFTRRNNTVHLRNVDYWMRAVTDGGIKIGVDAASLRSILLSFPIEAEGKVDAEGNEKTAVIDVTKLFTSDPPEISAKGMLGGQAVDASRSFIDRIKAFPTNIETRSNLTWSLAGRGGSFFGANVNPSGLNSVTATVHYSLVLLPEKPMTGRLADSRLGYFNIPFEEYGRPDHRARMEAYIARFRLEKKDPAAAISDPVKPITFYMAREVPEKWRRAIKLGVEDWQPAFEQAGFKNAIICLDAPSREQDPDWDPEDARYSVIRWAPSMIQNAMGPSVQDPRSGETISAHIIMWHNVLQLLENWYFVQASPMDPRASRLPFTEELMDELVRYVTAHEVGHTLGLMHNFKASSSFSIAQLRSPQWTNQWGTEASIMDYGRNNYVAQPGDGARLTPKLGPYDYFAIEWGYKPIPQARTPEDEKPILDQLAAKQVENPMLRFGWRFDDPTSQTEDLGDDPIEATRLGLLNIRRIAKNLIPATTKLGHDYSLTAEMYGELQGQRFMELNHVTRLVGGYVETNYHAGRGAEVYKPVPVARQALAIKFLLENGFQTPSEMLDPALLGRIQPYGQIDSVVGVQNRLLASLLSEARVKRMLDLEAVDPKSAYTVSRMVGDLQGGIWSEIGMAAPSIDPFRRGLQRAYLRTFDSKINGGTQTELKGIAKVSLRNLARTIDKAIPKAGNVETAAHLAESRAEIERIMKPANVIVSMPAPSVFSMFGISPERRFCSYDEGIGFHFDEESAPKALDRRPMWLRMMQSSRN